MRYLRAGCPGLCFPIPRPSSHEIGLFVFPLNFKFTPQYVGPVDCSNNYHNKYPVEMHSSIVMHMPHAHCGAVLHGLGVRFKVKQTEAAAGVKY